MLCSFCAGVRFCCAWLVPTLAPVEVALDCALAPCLAATLFLAAAIIWALLSAVCAAVRLLCAFRSATCRPEPGGHLLLGRGQTGLRVVQGLLGILDADRIALVALVQRFLGRAEVGFASSSTFCALLTASCPA